MRLDSPINFTKPVPPKTRKAKSYKVVKATPKTPQRKRRRALSDDLGPSRDQENVTSSKPSTPKRQRRAPPSLPLGLEKSDFEALTPHSQSHTSFNLTPDTTFLTPSQPLPFHIPNTKSKPVDIEGDTEMGDGWTAQDDDALVSLILNKLRLKQSDWDECAQILGKGHDSIGERWRMLVGEGEVGLRRSKGGLKRKGLRDWEGVEFGPEIEKGV